MGAGLEWPAPCYAYILDMETNYIFSFAGQAAFKRKYNKRIMDSVTAFGDDPYDVVALQELVWVCTYHTHKGKTTPEDVNFDSPEDMEAAIHEIRKAVMDSVNARVAKQRELNPEVKKENA